MAMECPQLLSPDLAVAKKIRLAFDRCPIFRDARISDPARTPFGVVCLDIRFGDGPAVFRVLAPTSDRAYAILDELASGIAEGEEGKQGR